MIKENYPTQPEKHRKTDLNKDITKAIGNRIKMRRSSLGISQSALGDKLGITFQQVQKYEKGSNRISASMLCKVADILGVNMSYFTNEYHEQNRGILNEEFPHNKEIVAILKIINRIQENDKEKRKKLRSIRRFLEQTIG